MTTTHAPKPGLDTIALHGGQNVDPATKARAVPIYQTTSYVFDDTGHAARLFALEEFGNIYTRIMNPTTDVLEQRIAALEGGVGALAVASGQAAVIYSILNIAHAGDHIVSSGSLYGGTYNAFFHTLPKYGITTTFVEPGDIAGWKAAVKPNTKAFFAETLGNPKVDVLDVRAVADAAHASGVPLILDNTLPTPMLLRPIEYGADVVVHSATKFIGGHGTSIGGLIVDAGNFDWSNGRFPELIEPDPSYHGAQYVKSFGPLAYILKMRVQLLRDVGAALSPFKRVHAVARDGNARLAHGAALLERPSRRRVPGRPRQGHRRALPGPARGSDVRHGPQVSAQRLRRDLELRVAGRTRVYRQAEVVLAAGERRRCQIARDPSGIDDPPAALAGRTGAQRNQRKHGPAIGRHRIDQRYPADLEQALAAV